MEDETENETEIKKPKLTRNELLAKARPAKIDKLRRILASLSCSYGTSTSPISTNQRALK